MHTNIIIIGAGGHAKVVIDAILTMNPACELIVKDDNPFLCGKKILNIPIQLSIDAATHGKWPIHIAIGDNNIRAQFYHHYKHHSAATIIHPNASVAKSAFIGEGSFIAAGAVIGPNTILGKGCIINHNAVIDHDCIVGDFCHIAPNATLGGAVNIANTCTIGANSTILPLIKISENATVGAGAVVTKPVQRGHTVVGIPARNAHSLTVAE